MQNIAFAQLIGWIGAFGKKPLTVDQVKELETLVASPTTVADTRPVLELVGYMTTGKKIQAIRRLRDLTGLGLKEAKDIVEGNDPSADVLRLVTHG